MSINWKCKYICFLKLTCKGLINLNLVMKSVGNLLPFQSFVIPKITHLLYLMRFLLAVRLGRDWSGRLAVPHINIYLTWGASDMPPMCDEVMWSPTIGNSLTNEANWWVFDDTWGIKWIQLQTLQKFFFIFTRLEDWKTHGKSMFYWSFKSLTGPDCF